MRTVRAIEQIFADVSSLFGGGKGCQVDWPPRGGRPRLRPGLWLPAVLVACLPAVAGQPLPPAPKGVVWEAPVQAGELYDGEVEALLAAYEAEAGVRLAPGERGRAGLKVNTRGGRGLSTPTRVLRATIEALEARGFARQDILIVDYSAHGLRQAGILPPLSEGAARFAGCPVIALDEGNHYEEDWFYDSPLPPALQQEPDLIVGRGERGLEEGARERKSFLPAPLLFEVDFWINLPVTADDPSLGIDGALANATLWNVSNSRRFLVNQATASAAVAEIAAIPELSERMLLHLLSLERYQFIGGPFFNSLYSRSEPKLWLSGDPVALDRLMFDRINSQRRLNGFPEIDPLPRQLPFAASLGLGVFDSERIRIEKVAPEPEAADPAAPPPEAEETP